MKIRDRIIGRIEHKIFQVSLIVVNLGFLDRETGKVEIIRMNWMDEPVKIETGNILGAPLEH